MRKYISRAVKYLGLFAFVSAALFAVGIVLIVVGSPNISLQILFTFMGGLMSVLFFGCFLAEKSRALVIDSDKIILPRGANRNGKTVFQKTVIKMDTIRSMESRFHKGDKIISNDCYFHILNMKDGSKVTVILYSYGKKAEKEILELIQKGIT